MKRSIIKVVSVHIGVIIAVCLYFVLPIRCPIYYFFHIPCPTCGMTRSFIALLNGNFSKSFNLNPMTVPFGILVLFAIHKDLLRIKKVYKDIIIISGTALTFSVYILRNFL